MNKKSIDSGTLYEVKDWSNQKALKEALKARKEGNATPEDLSLIDSNIVTFSYTLKRTSLDKKMEVAENAINALLNEIDQSGMTNIFNFQGAPKRYKDRTRKISSKLAKLVAEAQDYAETMNLLANSRPRKGPFGRF